jgi:gas vesicle protein
VTKFLLGFGVGVALGIMFAPAKGEETRARLREKAGEIANLPRKKAAEMADASKQKAAELGEKIGRQTAEAVVEVVKQSVVGKDKSA